MTYDHEEYTRQYLASLDEFMKPEIIFTDGIAMWNDARGGVHNPTYFRNYLRASYLPVPDITVKHIPESFELGGKTFAPGSWVEFVDGRATRGISAEEFARTLEVKGTV